MGYPVNELLHIVKNSRVMGEFSSDSALPEVIQTVN